MKKDLAVQDEQGLTTRPDMLSVAIEKGATVEQMGQLMELQERYEANEAKKAYHVAMAAFKADPPQIDKDAHVSYSTSKGRTDYKHATLANVTNKINASLSEHGLSAAWQTEQDKDGISVTCNITHVMGHSESTTLKTGADTSGGKNSIQAIGSTVTYLQRYTILSLTGLATAEMDDDGIGSEAEYISDEQVVELTGKIEEKDIEIDMFLSYMESESIEKIFVGDFKKANYAIDNAKGKKK